MSTLKVNSIEGATGGEVDINATLGSIPSLVITGVTTVSAGTTSAPAITPSGDSNTGIFFPSADTIAFAEGGAEALRIDSSGRLGIGTNNPTAPLHISGADAANAKIKLEDNDNGFAASEINVANGGRDLRIAAPQDIYFEDLDTNTKTLYIKDGGNVGIGTDNPGQLLNLYAATTPIVRLTHTTASSYAGLEVYEGATQKAAFNALGSTSSANGGANAVQVWNFTNAPTVFATNNTERLRITGIGSVGIGLTDPLVKVHISDSVTSVGSTGTEVLRIANTRVNTGSGAVALRFVNNEISGTNQYTRAQIAAEYDGTSNNNGRLMFATADTNGVLQERARFNSTGAFVFAGGTTNANGIGIAFPATQSASTNANTLDDYEEGTWTPRIGDSSNNLATANSANAGTYTKIGNRVLLTGRVQTSSVVGLTGASTAFVTGLPFSIVNTNGGRGGISVGYANNLATGGAYAVTGYGENGDTRISLVKFDGTTGVSALTVNQWSDDGDILFSFVYETT